ncbi:hypothetical protein C8Q80DRAFT_1117832 [Daedaleopsis nitida]|nr:hypothetical protein C8Q80DRAFT_1117832 [Daedaleopsis nitida]
MLPRLCLRRTLLATFVGLAVCEPVILLTIDDADPQIEYAGPWTKNPISDPKSFNNGGSLSLTNTPNAHAVFYFSGATGVSVFGSFPAAGTFDMHSVYTIDGTNSTGFMPPSTISRPEYRQRFFQSTLLSPGRHQLTITNLAKNFYFDYIQLTMVNPPTSAAAHSSGTSVPPPGSSTETQGQTSLQSATSSVPPASSFSQPPIQTVDSPSTASEPTTVTTALTSSVPSAPIGALTASEPSSSSASSSATVPQTAAAEAQDHSPSARASEKRRRADSRRSVRRNPSPTSTVRLSAAPPYNSMDELRSNASSSASAECVPGHDDDRTGSSDPAHAYEPLASQSPISPQRRGESGTFAYAYTHANSPVATSPATSGGHGKQRRWRNDDAQEMVPRRSVDGGVRIAGGPQSDGETEMNEAEVRSTATLPPLYQQYPAL